MRYTVTWPKSEEDRLLEFWLAASDRPKLTAAADQLDKHLRSRPYASAIRVTQRLYELQVAPLAVAYYIHDDDRQVEVVGVRLLVSKP